MIISIDAIKGFQQNSTSLYEKSPEQLRIEGIQLNIVKAMYTNL
jgi:hypothetical protein